MNLIDMVNQDHLNPQMEDFPRFRVGDTIAVHGRVKEGSKSRTQIFEGVVIALKRPRQINGHFRVRKISNGVGVERVFPFHCPNVQKVKVVQRGKTRRSKLYYLRKRSGKSARISIDYEGEKKS